MGAALEGHVSSTGGGADDLTSGTYEDAMMQIDPDDPAGMGIDGDDNGVLNGNAMFPGSVVSDTLSLNEDEPQGELPADMSGAADSLSNLTVDFGMVPLHSIGNEVFVDANNNGLKEGSEDGIPGVEVILHYVDTALNMCVALDTVLTDAQGNYLFDSLIAGDYIVELPSRQLRDEPGFGRPCEQYRRRRE